MQSGFMRIGLEEHRVPCDPWRAIARERH